MAKGKISSGPRGFRKTLVRYARTARDARAVFADDAWIEACEKISAVTRIAKHRGTSNDVQFGKRLFRKYCEG